MALKVDIKKDFGTFSLETAFEADRSVLGILGESGCGKSMTLRCIAGIVKPDEGYIELNGKVLFDSAAKIDLKPQQRHVGLLFQNYALFPNMNVEQNLWMGLKPYEKDKEKAKAKINDMLERFYLTDVRNHRPSGLSGGQQQRCALARILLSSPGLLMLDEPFSALDEFLRWNLELELADVLKEFEGPTLFVSHSRDEIYRICDNVCVMKDGHGSKVMPVRTLFEKPGTRAAAYLSGCKNFSGIRVTGPDHVFAEDWNVQLFKEGAGSGRYTDIGVRSHFIRPVDGKEADGGENIISCRIHRVIEDVFGMIVMVTPDGAAGDIRMEFSKEEWKSWQEKYGDRARILIQLRSDDIMLLEDIGSSI